MCAQNLIVNKVSEFTVDATKFSDQINGQIEWPSGELQDWDGSVIVFISSTNPINRDGWGVRSLETVAANRSPLMDLSEALLVTKNMVVRIDNPGVLHPSKLCREKIRGEGLTDAILIERCFDLDVLYKQTPERFVKNLEQMLLKLEKLVPATKKQLVLMGFSEGLSHVIEIVKHGRFRPKNVISIGSPAQALTEATRWQTIDRIVDLMDDFDLNHDGIITTDEMKEAHANGVGSFVGNINGLLPPNGQWKKSELWKVRKIMEKEFEDLMVRIRKEQTLLQNNNQESLQWNKSENGVAVPDITTSAINAHFLNTADPLIVLRKHKIPSLWLWGGLDRQVSAVKQQQWIDDHKHPQDKFKYIVIPGRHHLLSTRADYDWFEPGYTNEVAEIVANFLQTK